MNRIDVCVRGAGAVGRSLALALAHRGFRVALCGPSPSPGSAGSAPPTDVRAYALGPQSVALLASLRVWDALGDAARTRVLDMRIAGDTLAALEFSAWQQCVTELAWIVDAAALDEALAAAVRYSPNIELVAQPVDAALQAICEGRDSATRDAMGAGFESHAYGHRAIAARLSCDRPNEGRAWQWFRSPDVLALLPFDLTPAGEGFALVWSLPDDRAAQLLSAPEAEFEDALMQATGAAAGRLTLASPRAAWPLRIGRARQWSGPGWVLVGDAAHAVHPLAGQGLNLGFADVECLSRVLGESRQEMPWRDAGDERTLRRYSRERLAPTLAMGALTDGLLQLFSRTDAPTRELRNRGMSLVNRLSPLKRWLAGQALDA